MAGDRGGAVASRPPRARGGRRRRWPVRVVISAVILALCLALVDTGEVYATFAAADPRWLLLAVAAYVVSQVGLAWRSAIVFRSLNRAIGFRMAVRYHLLSNGIAQALPTSFGGEAAKVVMMRRRVGLGRGVRAAVVNRILGLVAVLVAALVATAAVAASGKLEAWSAVPLGLGLVASLTPFMALAFPESVARLVLPWRQRRLTARPVRLALLLYHDLGRALRPPRLVPCVVASLLVLGTTLLTLVCVAAGLRSSIPVVLWAAPFMILAMHVPVSFGGWGAREAGAITAFEAIGMGAETALAVSVSYGLVNLAGSLLGAGAVLAVGIGADDDEVSAPRARSQTSIPASSFEATRS